MSILFSVLIALSFMTAGACFVAGFIRVYQVQTSPQNRITNVIGAIVTFGVAVNAVFAGIVLLLLHK